jgi:pimeloyl-ACP methyl ester carboxylesterase
MRRLIFVALPTLVLVIASFSSMLSQIGVGLTGLTATYYERGTVLLIPGHGGNESSLDNLTSKLKKDGFVVNTVDIGDGSGDIATYAETVVSLGREAKGPVSLVGYSQGGLIARAAAQLAPDLFGRVATIATPHDGTNLAAAAFAFQVSCDTSCKQMVPGSPFLASLTLPIVSDRWLALYTTDDNVVMPAESAVLDGATNVAIDRKCNVSYDHYEIVASPETVAAVSAFLTSGRQPRTC